MIRKLLNAGIPPEEDEAQPSKGTEARSQPVQPNSNAKVGGGADIVHLQAAGASVGAAMEVTTDLSSRAQAATEDAQDLQEADDEETDEGESSQDRQANVAPGRLGWKKAMFAVSQYLQQFLAIMKKAGSALKVVTRSFSFITSALESFSELADELRLSQHFKIIVSFVQILGSFVSFQVEWPPALTQFMSDIGGLVQFNVVELPKLSCLWAGVDFWSTLLATTAGPIVVFILFALPLGVCKLKGMCFGWTDATKEQFASLKDQFFNNFLFGAFLIYPIASLSSLQAFNCHETLKVVRADMRMACPDITSFTGLYSIVCFFIYPVGMPVGFYLVMKLNRVPEIARSKRVNRAFTNLLTMYNKTVSTLEGRMVAQLVGRVEGDALELDRRVERFYRRVVLLEHDEKDAFDEIETDMHLHRCIRKHFQLQDDETFDKVAVTNLVRNIVEKSNTFVGMETMASISNSQGAILLQHDWPTSGSAGKGRAALKKDIIKTLFKKFGAPPQEPPWASPFGKYYPDPRNEENREFYYGKTDEQLRKEEEEKKYQEAEAAKLEEEKAALKLKRQGSMMHQMLKKTACMRISVFCRSSGEMPENDEEALKRKAERSRAQMIFQLEELVLKMLRLQVIACPTLTWDPNSPNVEEKLAIKRSGMIFSMFQVRHGSNDSCINVLAPDLIEGARSPPHPAHYRMHTPCTLGVAGVGGAGVGREAFTFLCVLIFAFAFLHGDLSAVLLRSSAGTGNYARCFANS